METPPTDIIPVLERLGVTFPTKKELIQALNLMTDFYNHTRLWSNNGYTPAELIEFEKSNFIPFSKGTFDMNPANQPLRHSEKKVGRSDPCPCDSGKKYKKCCLLNA